MADQYSDIIQEKSALREKMRFRRSNFLRNLPAIHKQLMFRALPSPLAHMLADVDIVGAYVAFGGEPDILTPLVQKLAPTQTLALPWFADRTSPMIFRQWRSGEELLAGPYRILQPSPESPEVAPQLLLMPLLAFDRDFNRLGQGGGHYDRYLEHHDPKRVGVAWSVQELDDIPTEPTDVPLDALLTEVEWITRT